MCLNLSIFISLYHYEVSVSQMSKLIDQPTLLFRPPITSSKVPTNNVRCWYLYAGLTPTFRYGARIQSSLPSLCFLKPQISFKGCPSAPLPPNITIMPLAVPVLHMLTEWQTRGGGFSWPVSTFLHSQLFKMSLTQTSLIDSEPMLPPWTMRYGLIKPSTWPYRTPGVVPLVFFTFHTALSTIFETSSSYSLSSASSPPPKAPPKTYKLLSIEIAAWAALLVGQVPLFYSFLILLCMSSQTKVSDVITYFAEYITDYFLCLQPHHQR